MNSWREDVWIFIIAAVVLYVAAHNIDHLMVVQ
jgi:hypothetical protein